MLEILNKMFWAIATALIVYSSVYFSVKLKFLQLNFKSIFLSVFQKSKSNFIQPFSILMLTLAGRIGVGSIAGIALCIYIGGAGSIFWLWIITFFTSILSYIETVLGSKYKEKDGDFYKGGPSYYIKNGLKNEKLGKIYALLIIICYIGGFLSIQTNTITKSFNEIILVSPIIIGFVIVFFTSLIIFGGIKQISKVTNKIVPIMGIFYLLITFYIILKNIYLLPKTFESIIDSAFSFKPFFSGFLSSFIVGVQRGIFSNEAGLGTGSIASSVGDLPSNQQGYIQIFGVYITSLLICTSTAIIILMYNYTDFQFVDLNGIELASKAFEYHLGFLGKIFIFVSILLFSFSTILTGYYYGESSLKYLSHSKIKIVLLKIITLIILFFGCVISSDFLWKLVDVLVAFLAIINIYTIFKLKEEIIEETKCYKVKKYDKM